MNIVRFFAFDNCTYCIYINSIVMGDAKKGEGTQMMNMEQFSPISKLSSTKPTQGRNLTGSARHIRDLTADIHTSIQQWNVLHLHGVTLLKNITDVKQNKSYTHNLQEFCDQLEIVCGALDDIVINLAEITRQIKVTVSLDRNKDKLFATWQNIKFGEVADTIYNAYSNEARVKRKVLENIAHYSVESWKMFFLASWVHQPLLPHYLTTYLESLLIETGHR